MFFDYCHIQCQQIAYGRQSLLFTITVFFSAMLSLFALFVHLLITRQVAVDLVTHYNIGLKGGHAAIFE